MILNAIWERYFLKYFFQMFFLFLFCFYGLYVLIDFASQSGTLPHHHGNAGWHEVAKYYLLVFSSRAEILIPLALLIAFVHTMCTLNANSELAAFMAGGFSIKMLMRPFVVIGLLSVLLMYANEQFFLPEALRNIRRMEDVARRQKHHHSEDTVVRHLILEDRSLLLFQNYDVDSERFFDVYWIESLDSIYRMKYLSPALTPPTGYFVDHLVRNEKRELVQEKAFLELPFAGIKFNQDLLQSAIIDPDTLPLTELAAQVMENRNDLHEKESKVLSALYWKLAIPWLCLFAIIAPAPYCVRFARQLPIFLIYVFSLFGLIAFYTLMDAAEVMAKRQVLSPLMAIGFPFLVVFFVVGWRFKRIESTA